MKNNPISVDQLKNFHRNNPSNKIFLVGTIFLLVTIFTTSTFITHNTQTLLNHAAAPAQIPSSPQHPTNNNKTQTTSQQHKSITDLKKLEKYLTVEAALLGVSDNVSLYFEDLNQHKEIAIDPTRSWIPASTIKSYVVLEAFRQRRVGLINFNQLITIKPQNVVPTELETEEFPLLREGTQATVKQLVEAMVVQSDNTAYNTLLDVLDRRSINATLRSLGFTETVVAEKLNLDDEQFQRDLVEPGRQPNTTTVKDLANFFDLLYNKQVPDSEQMLAIFKQQKINTMLPALIPATTEIAHKTGEWAPIYHDGGVIYKSGEPFVFVVFSNSNDPSIVAKLTHVAYYQNAESVGQTLDRDKAMLPVHHFITRASLTTLKNNKKVLGAKTSIISPQKYTVQEGDSLYSIAKKFYGDGNRWPDIARRNYLSSPTDINPGQVFIVPSVTITQHTSNEISPVITAADLGITTSDLTIGTHEAKQVDNANVIPGSLAYPVKHFLEERKIADAKTPTEKINAYLAFANSRLSEAKTFLSQGNTTYIQTLLNESENALSHAASLAKASNISQEELVHIKQLNDLHFAVLAQNINHVSPQSKEQFVDAIYNFYQNNQREVMPIVKASITDNPIHQEPIIGTISKIQNNVATVKFDNGQTKDLAMSTATSIRDFHDKLPDTKYQLKIGEKIAIVAQTTRENKILPRFILHNIPKELPDKHEGTILRIFPQKDKLEILNNQGKKEEIHVNSNTILRSKDTSVSLEGITPGSRVTIFGEEQGSQKIEPTEKGEQNPNIKLFLPTPVPEPTSKKTDSSKDSGNQKQDPGNQKTENNSNSNKSSSGEQQEVKVIKATSLTVTQNSSGANAHIVTQSNVQKQDNKSTPSNTAKENKNENKKDSPKGSDSNDHKNDNKGKEQEKKDK